MSSVTNIRPVFSQFRWGKGRREGGNLACCIENFTFVFMAFQFDGLAEGVLYSGVIALNEMTIHKLDCQRTLALHKSTLYEKGGGWVPTLRDPRTTILRDFVVVGFFVVDMAVVPGGGCCACACSDRRFRTSALKL